MLLRNRKKPNRSIRKPMKFDIKKPITPPPIPQSVLTKIEKMKAATATTTKNGVPTLIVANPGTIITVRNNEGYDEYTLDGSYWIQIEWPLTIRNIAPSLGNVEVHILDGMVFYTNQHYFIADSNNIIFGNPVRAATANFPDFYIPFLYILDINGYPGLVQNGNGEANGYSNVTITNIYIKTNNTTVLNTESGWFAQPYFGKGASNNKILNCLAYGFYDIEGGTAQSGIVGGYAASENGVLDIWYCNFYGSIGVGGGGIVGNKAATIGGTINIYSCFTGGGDISTGGGGIVGKDPAVNGGTLNIARCFSTGSIAAYAGGIVGKAYDEYFPAAINITNCFSNGAIYEYAGGIIGHNSRMCTITKCFSVGNLVANTSGGIVAPDFNTSNVVVTNNYTIGTFDGPIIGGIFAGSNSDNPISGSANNYSNENNGTNGWNNSQALATLDVSPNPLIPIVYGDVWFTFPEFGENSVFFLVNTIASPYSAELTFLSTPTSTDIDIYKTVVAGESVSQEIQNYFNGVVSINDSDPSSFSGFSFDYETGSIVTSDTMAGGTYVVKIFSALFGEGFFPYFCMTNIHLTVIPKQTQVKSYWVRSGCRDASDVARRRATITKDVDHHSEIGVPKNTQGAVIAKDRREALTRTRSSGSVVPRKVYNKYLS